MVIIAIATLDVASPGLAAEPDAQWFLGRWENNAEESIRYMVEKVIATTPRPEQLTGNREEIERKLRDLWTTVFGDAKVRWEFLATGLALQSDSQSSRSHRWKMDGEDLVLVLEKAPPGFEGRFRVVRRDPPAIELLGYGTPIRMVLVKSPETLAGRGRPDVDSLQIIEAAATLAGHGPGETHAAFAPNGQWIATGAHDGTLRLWRWNEQVASLHSTFSNRQSTIKDLAFSRDGQSLLAGAADGTVTLWRMDGTGQFAVQALVDHGGHTEFIVAVGFMPQPGQILTATHSRLRMLKVDGNTFKELGVGHSQNMDFAVTDSGGGWVMTSQNSWGASGPRWDQTLVLWRTQPAGTLERITSITNEWRPSAAAFSPDGFWLVTAAAGSPLTKSRNPSGEWTTTSGKPPRLDVWSRKDAIDVTEIRLSSTLTVSNHISGIAFSPDGRSVVTASDDNLVHLWTIASGAMDREARLVGHNEKAVSVCVSSDGKWILSGAHDGTARIWPRIK